MLGDVMLQLLPSRGLDQSILIAVLVGLWVMLLFTETLGWVFAGVVVPGYLASVLVIQPATGAAIFAEALVVFLLARFAALTLSRTGVWTEIFGRDRFFLIVLISVFVRQHDQTWLLPEITRWIDGAFGTHLHVQRDFYSIGLVLVPLTANMFWKLDARRGTAQIAVAVGLTYLVLATVLLPYTNLSFSNFELTYENTAIDFLGNAKAYIIMLCGALLAAYLNLRYGWDFNGILVPALLSLLWLTPLKLLATLAEAVFLLYATLGVLRLPVLRTANLEGPRKIVLVFTLGFALKWATGFALGDFLPGIKITDLFAFGYLLSSLLATKMLQKKSARAVLLPALVTSIAGFVLGSAIGFVLELWVPKAPEIPDVPPRRVSSRLSTSTLGTAIAHAANVDLRDDAGTDTGGSTVRAHRNLWLAVGDWLEVPTGESRLEVESAAQSVGYQLLAQTRDGRGGFELAPKGSGSHTAPTGLLYPGANGPVLTVPHPAREPAATKAAALLCEKVECAALVIAGVDPAQGLGSVGASARPRGFHWAHNALASQAHHGIVQVRVDPTFTGAHAAQLHLGGPLHERVPLGGVLPGRIELVWEPPPAAGEEWGRDEVTSVLRIAPNTVDELLLGELALPPVTGDASLLGLLRAPVADPESAVSWVAPSDAELAVLERGLRQLLRALDGAQPNLRQAQLALQTLALLDLRAQRLEDCGDGRPCWIVSDLHRAPNERWLTVAIAEGNADSLAVSIPRPTRSLGSLRLGVEFAMAARARAITIAGIDASDGDYQADPVVIGNLRTPFHAAHQALDRAGMELIAQIRGIAAWRMIPSDLVIGLGRPVLDPGQIPTPITVLLGDDGPLSWLPRKRFADGSPQLFALAGNGIPQIEYSRGLGQAHTAVFWFSEQVRARYHLRPPTREQERLARIGLDTSAASESQVLLQGLEAPAQAITTTDSRFDTASALLRRYAATHNVRLLIQLRGRAQADPAMWLRAGTGLGSGLPCIALGRRAGSLERRALVLLSEDAAGDTALDLASPEHRATLRDALFRRARSLTVLGATTAEDPS